MSEGAEKKKKKPTGGLAPLFLGMVIAVPMVLLVECGHTEGRIAVTGGPHGEFVVEADDCHALLPYGTYGAVVRGAGQDSGAAYVMADPTTERRMVQLDVPGSCDDRDATGCAHVFVAEEECSTFEVHVENTQTTVNDVRLVRGHATLECTLADGTEVSGHVDFDGC